MISSKGLLVLCLLILSTVVKGQTKVSDSLEQKLKSATKESKVDILNKLTYEFITNDNTKALAYNSQALTLSKQLGYVKGEAVAYTYKGVYEYLTGLLPDAHKDLHKGLRLSIQAGDLSNQGYTLLQLGNCGLEEVENDSALFYFNGAYKIFKDSANPAVLSKIYRNMSAVYGQRYQYDKQQFYLDRSIAIRRLLPDKMLLTEGLALKANNALRSGDIDGAEIIIKEIEGIVKNNPEFAETRNDLRHLKALIMFHRGKFEEASILVDSARNYYFKVSLLRKYVTLLMDISKVFSDRGEYELALNNLYPALKLSKLRGFDSETYVIRNRIGWINFHLGDYTQALRLANEAISSKPKHQLKADLANALTLKGVSLSELNNFKEAKISLDSALNISKRLNDSHGISESLLNLGALKTKQKEYNEAMTMYQESIEHAKASNYYYGLAWSTWGLGDIYFRNGDLKNATRFLDQSEQFAHQINANEILIMDFNTRRDLLAAQNRFKESLIYSIMASKLNDSIHRTDLARRFVNLEKMQEIEQRDRDIKVLQQDKQLSENKIKLQESKLRQQFILLIGGLIGLALLAVLAFVYYRFYARIKMLNVTITDKNTRIQAQADKLHEVNIELNQLYLEVSEQNEEIQTQSNKLAESNKNMSDLNRGLERIVLEKTLELRTTNEELVRYNNELLQFSYTVSHNLRGPVARLLGLSGLAQTEQELTKAREWINLISKTASDLDLIIKDLSKLLDLRNEPNQYREVVEFDKEWRQSISLLQDSLTGEEEIIANFDALPQIVTVRAMIQSIFYNLLSNAIKFRSPDRTLRVIASSRIVDGKAFLEIADNGLGFDTQLHKEKVFKLYKRFHTHVEGRGLGLYLIKAQLDVLNGSIDVESVPGRGSIFRIEMPLGGEDSVIHHEK